MGNILATLSCISTFIYSSLIPLFFRSQDQNITQLLVPSSFVFISHPTKRLLTIVFMCACLYIVHILHLYYRSFRLVSSLQSANSLFIAFILQVL